MSAKRCVKSLLLAVAYNGINWQRNEEEVGLLRPMQPVTWEDYLFKGMAMDWADPAVEMALMDKAVDLKRNSPLSRLIRAGARGTQAMSSGDMTMMRSALADLEAARPFLPPGSGWLASSFTWTHVQAARLCGQAGRGDEQQQHLQAAEEWGKLLEQLPGGLWTRIAQLDLCGRETEAFELMQRTVAQHPQWVLPFCPYGDALYRQGRLQEAYQVYAGLAEAKNSSEYTEYMLLITQIELLGGGHRAKADIDRFYTKYTGGMVELGAPDTYRFAGLMDEANRRGKANYERLPPRLSFFSVRYRRWAQFFAGVLDETAWVEASRGSGKELVELYTSIGILHLAQGDRAGAKERFHKSMQTGFYGNPYYQFARNLLARLDQDPNWPPWLPRNSHDAAANQGKASQE